MNYIMEALEIIEHGICPLPAWLLLRTKFHVYIALYSVFQQKKSYVNIIWKAALAD